ncbi:MULTISPECIES: AAA family ATPase [unclassified Nonomuraea]|uniref:ATP-dependent nuclease n=1 Tax=unclassified Nonomuraea TaxID=2593643 RepID=UPI0033EEB1D1
MNDLNTPLTNDQVIMKKVHQDLSGILRAGKFEPFIQYIRFPHFRNLREGTRIDFVHPITVLVGANGTNKTAILRALQGCPDLYNVGQYWFSTDLDPIKAADRHRFIHGYVARSVGEVVEVVKSRIERANDPDYFEPARPLIQDGMAHMPRFSEGDKLPPERSKTRWKAIQKNVVYLDFRSELSAYDKYFFHAAFDGRVNTLAEKKAFIRRRSSQLAFSFKTGRESHVMHRRERIVEAAKEMTELQRQAISAILGRNYESVLILKHTYFGVEGATIMMKASGLQYSEAFAGSGEFAVAMLVNHVTEAPERSLVLLDEPEVSLHPGAQRKLMDFLCQQAKARFHQVVISTHSPEIVRDLPARAIKVFHSSDTDGKVELISQESEATEAFFRLGVPKERTKTIYVEDRLAAAIVRRAIRPLGESFSSQLEIQAIPGGTNSIQQHFIPAFALSGNMNCLILLDGDQASKNHRTSVEEVSDADLEIFVKEMLNGAPKLSLNGSGGQSAPGEKALQLRTILGWCHTNLDYLPGRDPESLLLEMTGETGAIDKAKSFWVELTRKALGRSAWEPVNSSEVLGEQERALARVDDDASELRQIRERVQKFAQQA